MFKSNGRIIIEPFHMIILVVFVFLCHLLVEPYAIADIFDHFGLQKQSHRFQLNIKNLLCV